MPTHTWLLGHQRPSVRLQQGCQQLQHHWQEAFYGFLRCVLQHISHLQNKSMTCQVRGNVNPASTCCGVLDNQQEISRSPSQHEKGALEACMAVCARLGELGWGHRAMLQQQMADAHVAHTVVLRIQRQVLKEAGDPTQPACRPLG